MKFFNLTTSRTKQFCETSSKNGKLSADLTALCHFVLHFFPSHVSKVLRLPRKSDAKSYEVLHLSRKIIPANLKIWCSKMQPLSGNQRLDLLTCLLEMSLVLPATRNAPLQILFKHLQTSHASSFFETVLYKTYTFCAFLARCRTHCAWKKRCDVQKWCEHGVSLPCCLQNVLCDTMAFTFSYFFNISTSKSAPNMQCGVFSFFSILTSKLNCASCHNGVHFFNSSTAKSAPTLRCF